MITSLTQITLSRLINLRWLSVLAMLCAALASPNILGTGELMPKLLAFTTLIASVNACLWIASRLYWSSEENIPLFSPLIQLGFDLAGWSVFIYLSGGASNPLISVFLPLVAIGAIALNRFQAWFLGFAAVLSYTFLWRFHIPLPMQDAERATYLHLLGMWLVFAVSAMVSIWFIQKMSAALHERDVALADAREKNFRNDWLISMGALAAGTTHELSTPLGTMNVLVDDWQEDPSFPAALRADLQLMGRQLETCRQTLNKLKERAGHYRRQEGGVVTDQWLDSLLQSWQSLHPATAMVVAIDPALRGWKLPFDPMMEGVLNNLLDNADKSGASRISLDAALEGEKLRLTVEDDGSGIAESVIRNVQAGQPTLSAHGMGIGLLIGRVAIERHGGRMSFARTGERGTRIKLELPLIAPLAQETSCATTRPAC